MGRKSGWFATQLQKLVGWRPPPVLYKYCAPARIDILQNGQIRFTQPPVFNDPFESAPAFLELASPKNLERNLEMVSRMQVEQGRMTEETRQAMLSKFRSWPKEMLNAFGPLFIEFSVRIVHLLSLTEKYDNLLMWAHYAESREGFVIGFKTGEPLLWHHAKWKSTDSVTKKVRYSRRRPTVNTCLNRVGWVWPKCISQKASNGLMSRNGECSRRYPRKMPHRLSKVCLRAITESGKLPTAPDYPVRLFTFPPSAISRIILGCRASHELSRTVASAVHEKYPHAELFKAERDPSDFA